VAISYAFRRFPVLPMRTYIFLKVYLWFLDCRLSEISSGVVFESDEMKKPKTRALTPAANHGDKRSDR
jgi:hypothetical protein